MREMISECNHCEKCIHCGRRYREHLQISCDLCGEIIPNDEAEENSEVDICANCMVPDDEDE